MNIESLSLLFDSRFSGVHRQDLKTILATWEIWEFDAKKISEGATRSNWVIHTADQKRYILRNAGSDLEWLNWQIAVLETLIQKDFPYAVPRPLPGKVGNPYCLYKTDYWVVYSLIPGELLGFQPNVTQSFNVGMMLGEYHQAIHSLKYHNMFAYELKLFEQESFAENLQFISHASAQSRLKDPEIELFAHHIPLFEQAYNHIPASDILLVKNLPKLPVHYDLHGKNILSSGDRVVGLIDFDALGIGPRIIDFQNALVYMAGGTNGIGLSKVKGFVEGYRSVWPLSVEEIKVTYSLMIERLMMLVTQIVARKCADMNEVKLAVKRILGVQDEYTQGLLSSLIWLINNKNLFIDTLYEKA